MLRNLNNLLFSNRLLILLTIVLRIFIHLDQQHTLHFNKDIPIEEIFGKNHLENCYELQAQLESDWESGIHNTLNYLLYQKNIANKRVTQMLRSKLDATKFIAKTSTKNILNILKNIKMPLKREILKMKFLTQAETTDFQFCPKQNIQEFVDMLTNESDFNELTIWFLLLTNVQLLLQPYLEKQKFPVPKTFGVCGLTLYEEYVGNTLQYFEYANFRIKLSIAKQLLDIAFKFTEGINGYHIYITDLTSDNLIYNTAHDKLYLIDLDTIYIVDGNNTKESEMIDYHDYIECNNDCFAFVPVRLCTNGLSDLNILSACVYLRENLRKDGTRGFLHPIPEQVMVKHTNLMELLDECVGGVIASNAASNFDLMSRFNAAAELSKLFTYIIKEW
ncbi:divergent protein kinase domain 2A [Eurosta solidaginis]|uniref:divergent protein kinase domain 2A n=1 Tax=Eurosta solidaginis TaxID=178769 RepID=UPI003530B6EF